MALKGITARQLVFQTMITYLYNLHKEVTQTKTLGGQELSHSDLINIKSAIAKEHNALLRRSRLEGLEI